MIKTTYIRARATELEKEKYNQLAYLNTIMVDILRDREEVQEMWITSQDR